MMPIAVSDGNRWYRHIARTADKWINRRASAVHPGHMTYQEWLITVETIIRPTDSGYAYDMDFMESIAVQLFEQGYTIPAAVASLLKTWEEMCDEWTVH